MSHIGSNVGEQTSSSQLTLGMHVCCIFLVFIRRKKNKRMEKCRLTISIYRWIEFRMYRLWTSCWCCFLIFHSGDFIYEIHNEGERKRTKKKSWKKPSSKEIQQNPIQSKRIDIRWVGEHDIFEWLPNLYKNPSHVQMNRKKESLQFLFPFVERKMATLRKEIGK